MFFEMAFEYTYVFDILEVDDDLGPYEYLEET